MKNCLYIEIGSLFITDDGNLYARKVWQRYSTCDYIGMTEHQFIEWCILIGNDFTKSYNRKLYNNITIPTSSIKGNDTSILQQLKTIILSQSYDFLLTSSDKDHQLAIEFSRSFYNHNDLTLYPYTNSKNNNKSSSNSSSSSSISSSSKSSSKNLYKFSKEEKLFLRLSYSNYPDIDIDDSVKEMKSSIISIILEALQLLMENDELMSFRWSIDDDHIYAIKQMVKIISTSTSTTTSTTTSSSVDIKSFNDYLVYHVIQLAFKEFIKEITNTTDTPSSSTPSSSSSSSPNNFINEFTTKYLIPSNYFSGDLFFTLLKTIRRSKMGDPSSSSSPSSSPSSPSSRLEMKLAVLLQDTSHLLVGSNNKSSIMITNTTTNGTTTTTTSSIVEDRLPIDEYKDDILKKLNTDRVIIIHGETGCGKSSRLPKMIYDDATSKNKECKMMISQPTRIAARSLMNRLRSSPSSLGYLVGLRLGNNIKDENDDTKIHFCTTGYLVRYLAHKPKHFQHHTHLIIDEIHTRSVDGDILCLLVKRLLKEHSTLKVILMSATIHTKLIAEYFTRDTDEYYGDMNCLSVGRRRFPLQIHYLENLLDRSSSISNFKIAGHSEELFRRMKAIGGTQQESIADGISKSMYSLTESIIKQIGVCGGGAILVFVAGIADIEEIMSRFEGEKYKTIAIHSDIPEDEQAYAFEPCKPDEVKIIIATNAAESSLTLPDVDFVLCLGQCKSIRYDPVNHKNMLLNTWISKASATQRAGRTGRVRPGVVYRLYTEELFNKFQDHDEAEIKRQTCDETILNLRYMLESTEGFQGVIPVLEDLMEPPSIENINFSFEYLHMNQLISKPCDDGSLTKLGYFAAKLSISSGLARMIAMGYRLGLGYETVIMAAGISLPKILFNIAIPMVQYVDDYIDIAKKTLLAQNKLDGGLYSQPIMFINIFSEYMTLTDDKKRRKWCIDHSISFTRIRQFISFTKNVLQNVSELMNDDMAFDVGKPVPELTTSRVNLLRFILTYTCDRNFIRQKPTRKFKTEQLHTVDIVSTNIESPLTDGLLSDIFPKNVDVEIVTKSKKVYTAPIQLLESRELGNDLIDNRVLHFFTNIFVSKGIMCSLVWTKAKRRDDVSGQVQNSLFLAIMKAVEKDDDGSMPYDNNTNNTFTQIHTIFRGNLKHVNDVSMSTCIVSFYTVPTFNDVDIEMLKGTAEKVDSCISLTIPVVGAAILTVTNLELSSDVIDSIFVSSTKHKGLIKEETVYCKQQLSFPAPTANGLLTDISIGLKLLYLYTLMNKNSKLRESIEVANIANSFVENSGMFNSYSAAGYHANANENDNLIINFGKLISTNWQYLNENNDIATKFSRQSIQAVSIACNDDGKNLSNKTQYAISSSIKIIGKSNMIICDGVSFLPPGTKWLSLAASCCGISLKDIPGHINCIALESSQTKTKGDLSAYELEKCKEVYDILSDLDADLKYDKNLKNMMELIFSEYI